MEDWRVARVNETTLAEVARATIEEWLPGYCYFPVERDDRDTIQVKVSHWDDDTFCVTESTHGGRDYGTYTIDVAVKRIE